MENKQPLCKLARIEILPEQKQVKLDLKLEGEVDLIHAFADYEILDSGIEINNFRSDREWLTELFRTLPATSNGKQFKLKSALTDLLGKFL